MLEDADSQWTGTRRWRRKVWESRNRLLEWAYHKGLEVHGNLILPGKRVPHPKTVDEEKQSLPPFPSGGKLGINTNSV